MEKGKTAKTEWLLLGITAVFLCGLLGLAWHDRNTAEIVETAVEVPQEEIRPDLSPLDINRAAKEELEALPGIGTELAGRILEYRAENGPFQSIEELTRVSGIGQGKLDVLKDRITVGGNP